MINILSYFKSAPDFTVWHSHPGMKSRLLITAGMDGDEYAGIESAQRLIKTYKGSIPITIIPIVNITGNKSKVSYSPLDNRYPKSIFPGSPFGSSSSKLIYKLSKYTKGVDYWIDLHCAANDEHLIPFIWSSERYPILSYLSGRTLIEKSIDKKIPYIMLETSHHLTWINQILENLDRPTKPNWKPTYNKIIYEKRTNQNLSSKNLLWLSPSIYVSGKMT